MYMWLAHAYNFVLPFHCTQFVVTISIRCHAEIEYALNKVGCSALIMAHNFKKSNYDTMMREVAPELNTCVPGALHAARIPTLRHVISIGHGHHKGMHSFGDVLKYATAGDVAEMQALSEVLGFDDPINIQL